MESAWLLALLPLAAFLLLVLGGRRLPGGGWYLAVGAIGAAFLLWWPVMGDLLARGPGAFSFSWLALPPLQATGFAFPGFELRFGLVVDPLAALMLGIVTLVALLVQIYSLGYMRGDRRFGWYFAAHSLFAAAMLALVLADNYLLLYFAWELVGLCSYLLIGFWYERRSAAEAAKKAFITTRVGDVGLLIGILLLWRATGTFEISAIGHAAESGTLDPGLLTLGALLVFAGAIGKSAQFPLHVWLPDAMEGPTPVSALIHAATMVAAGVYLVARSFTLFVHAPGALAVVTAVGLFTALLAGTLALVNNDIKRVLAYSTVSQLGFMMLALGSLGLTAAMFHLYTHAFAKALLFLAAGSVIHGLGTQDIWRMGGLLRRMPLTGVTFTIGALALAGFPLLSGFFSKDEILKVVAEHQNPAVLALTALGALVSALYMGRVTWVVFFGRPRDHELHPHESPFVMTVPLLILATLTVVAGYVALDPVGQSLGLHGGFGEFLYHEHPEPFSLNGGLVVLSLALAAAGLGGTWLAYVQGGISPSSVAARFGVLYRWAAAKYYVDELYQAIIDRVVLVLAGGVAWFDRHVVNDAGVDGTGRATVWAGFVLKFQQTGKFYNYAIAMIVGIVVLSVLAGALKGP